MVKCIKNGFLNLVTFDDMLVFGAIVLHGQLFTVNFYIVRVMKNQNFLENLFENLYEPQGQRTLPWGVLTDDLCLTYYSTV